MDELNKVDEEAPSPIYKKEDYIEDKFNEAIGEHELKSQKHHRSIKWFAVLMATVAIIALGWLEYYILKDFDIWMSLGESAVFLAISPIASFTI